MAGIKWQHTTVSLTFVDGVSVSVFTKVPPAATTAPDFDEDVAADAEPGAS